MIDVVRADAAAEHSLKEVVLLVRAFRGLEDGEGIRAARVTQSHQLLCGELHGFFPRRFAERRVPIVGRCGAVARITERRATCRRGVERIRARAPLRGATFVLHLEPGSTASWPFGSVVAARGERVIVYPRPVHLLPSPPNERPREAVAVLDEVVAEAALHARGALIRRVLFDPGTLHVDHLIVLHLKVDLTSDAAVRAHAAHGAIENGQSRGYLAQCLTADAAVRVGDGRVARTVGL